MKTLYLHGVTATTASPKVVGDVMSKEKQWFVIGVRGSDACSLETLARRYPQFKIKQRFREVVNANYLEAVNNPGGHILQPAIVYWEETKV